MSPPDRRERPRNRFRLISVLVLATWSTIAAADPAAGRQDDRVDCPVDDVHDHVREQLAEFGPRSFNREYFGFVYLADGKIASAVVRGEECRGGDRCHVDTADAARAIPQHARVLGEWHTHPASMGSRALSADDVRGAHRHRHFRCYQAYYSTPLGDIYAWDVRQTSVPAAMATRVHVGKIPGIPALDDGRLARMASARRPAASS